MHALSSGDWLTRLHTDVVNYESDHFSLKDDLVELSKVSKAETVHCTILSCARILEVLVADALCDLATANVFANLETLQSLNLVSSANLNWMHSTRRTGNDVRHVRRRVDPQEAELALLFTERCLEWFFCRYHPNDRLRSITTDEQPIGLCDSTALRAAVEAFDSSVFNPVAVADETLQSGESVFANCAPLSGALAEELINCDKFEPAERVLNWAEARFPDDLRILQLRGLYWRRSAKRPEHNGDLQRAIEHMEPLYRKYGNDDETIGIMAAMYKALWEKNETDTDSLRKAHRAYRTGWKNGRKNNGYLGINAATTALWLGQSEEAELMAADVRDGIHRTMQLLILLYSDTHAVPCKLDFWVQLQLGEAHLLLGDLDKARQTYIEAFEQNKEKAGAINSAIDQARKILEVLGLPDDTDKWRPAV